MTTIFISSLLASHAYIYQCSKWPPMRCQQPCGFPSQQAINFCISHVLSGVVNLSDVHELFLLHDPNIFRHPTFIAAMGNSPSAPGGRQSVATTCNMDANFQYSGQEWHPGPPTVMDLTKYMADSENPNWWSIQCATDGCTSWLYLVKTRQPQYQRCNHCNKPWVESFFQLGPHKVWHGSEEAANN